MPKVYYCVECGIKCNGIRCKEHFFNSRKVSQDDKDIRLRAWNLNKKYGITLEDFESYWIAQIGKCFICKTNMIMPTKGRGQPLNAVAVDHDHLTNEFRGLLCNGCNKGLGLFRDNIQSLNNAIKYLEGYNETAG